MNETVGTVANNTFNVISYVSQTLTEKLTNFLTSQGINITARFSSLVILLISLLVVYVGIKIAQPILKVVLIVLGAILILGMFVPFW